MSDLHFDFHPDGGRGFMSSLPRDAIDVLVIAGDLSNALELEDTLRMVCDMVPDVVFVAGNHEFYGGSVRDIKRLRERGIRSNLHWLENSETTIRGQRFVGATLWFGDDPQAYWYRSSMNDFWMIKGFLPWVFEQAERSARFLRDHVQAGDVVVTHHLPTALSVHPNWRGSRLQSFYLHNLDPLVSECRAKLWVHGHTHESFDYVAGTTRVVCNPYGYSGSSENLNFKPDLIVDTNG